MALVYQLLKYQSQYVPFLQDKKVLVLQFDLSAGVSGEQHPVTLTHFHRQSFVPLDQTTRPGSQHAALLRPLFGCLGQYDATAGLSFLLNGLYQQMISQGTDFQGHVILLSAVR
jgi:hypothetical protein